VTDTWYDHPDVSDTDREGTIDKIPNGNDTDRRNGENRIQGMNSIEDINDTSEKKSGSQRLKSIVDYSINTAIQNESAPYPTPSADCTAAGSANIVTSTAALNEDLQASQFLLRRLEVSPGRGRSRLTTFQIQQSTTPTEPLVPQAPTATNLSLRREFAPRTPPPA
jgi:hypothetical protein